jgi:hypothetical protein
MVTEAKEQNLSDLDLPLADCHSLRAMPRAPAGPGFLRGGGWALCSLSNSKSTPRANSGADRRQAAGESLR